jgi:hypothetical protein
MQEANQGDTSPKGLDAVWARILAEYHSLRASFLALPPDKKRVVVAAAIGIILLLLPYIHLGLWDDPDAPGTVVDEVAPETTTIDPVAPLLEDTPEAPRSATSFTPLPSLEERIPTPTAAPIRTGEDTSPSDLEDIERLLR